MSRNCTTVLFKSQNADDNYTGTVKRATKLFQKSIILFYKRSQTLPHRFCCLDAYIKKAFQFLIAFVSGCSFTLTSYFKQCFTMTFRAFVLSLSHLPSLYCFINLYQITSWRDYEQLSVLFMMLYIHKCVISNQKLLLSDIFQNSEFFRFSKAI